jgi:hypothetical protein
MDELGPMTLEEGNSKHSSTHHCVSVTLSMASWHSIGMVGIVPFCGTIVVYLRFIASRHMEWRRLKIRMIRSLVEYVRPEHNSDWK